MGTEVLSRRTSDSRPKIWIVKVATEGYNQDGAIVVSYLRTFMVHRQGFLPAADESRPDEASLPDVKES